MKVHLERVTPAHVQTFASACPESDQELARAVGFTGVLQACLDMVSRSREAKALVEHGPLLDRVLAIAGVYANQRPAYMWVHTAPAFLEAGFSALRTARLLVDRWCIELGELRLEVPTDSAALIRMAEWLGFEPFAPAVAYGGRIYTPTRKAA